jgi:AmmeMemoRadiSam system protein B
MKKTVSLKANILILTAFLSLWVTGCNWAGVSKHTPCLPTHQNSFFDGRYFSKETFPIETFYKSKIYGAVVPHHLLAHKLISRVFQSLQLQKPPLVILIGPNHYNKGDRILTSTWGWQTPFGTVEPCGDVINDLVKTSFVKVDNMVFEKEHSVGNIMPFIKYYLPDAKVVPIILHHDVTKAETDRLAQELTCLQKQEEAIIIASVDFSHYLTKNQAEQNDQETIRALNLMELDRLFSFGNDHLDSPAALATLLISMKNVGLNEFTILDNTNSGKLLGNDLIETTSYITLIYHD